MLFGFSCLSWIEFIFDISMWASILVYIFEVIMEAMMMMFHTFLCYDMIHFMMIMHVIIMYTLWCWCTPIQYDVHAYHSVMMLSYALWCILDVDYAYTVHTKMMMMHIWWWGCIPYGNDAYLWWWCMTMHAFCSVKVEQNYLFSNCVWWGIQWCTWVVYGSEMTYQYIVLNKQMSSNRDEQQRWEVVMSNKDE